jgi:hypothetical protein
MFGGMQVDASGLQSSMFNSGRSPTDAGDSDVFDTYDAYAPQHLPEPGPFLEDCAVLTGEDHAAFHRLTRSVFEDRGVYDITFGYNLARLNLDRRHEDAGFRYGLHTSDAPPGVPVEGFDGGRVLHAEFTPTTAFCPQSEQLTKGAFRAWNGLADRHEYDLVRVRVHPMHQRAVEINAGLEALENAYCEDGSLSLDSAAGGNEDDSLSGSPTETPF